MHKYAEKMSSMNKKTIVTKTCQSVIIAKAMR